MAALTAPEAFDAPRAIGFGARNAAGDDAHGDLSMLEATAPRPPPACHPRCSAAFLLDPDGNRIDLVSRRSADSI